MNSANLMFLKKNIVSFASTLPFSLLRKGGYIPQKGIKERKSLRFNRFAINALLYPFPFFSPPCFMHPVGITKKKAPFCEGVLLSLGPAPPLGGGGVKTGAVYMILKLRFKSPLTFADGFYDSRKGLRPVKAKLLKAGPCPPLGGMERAGSSRTGAILFPPRIWQSHTFFIPPFFLPPFCQVKGLLKRSFNIIPRDNSTPSQKGAFFFGIPTRSIKKGGEKMRVVAPLLFPSFLSPKGMHKGGQGGLPLSFFPFGKKRRGEGEKRFPSGEESKSKGEIPSSMASEKPETAKPVRIPGGIKKSVFKNTPGLGKVYKTSPFVALFIPSPPYFTSPPFLTFRIWLLKASLLLIPWDKSHTFLEVWRSHMRKAEGRGGFSESIGAAHRKSKGDTLCVESQTPSFFSDSAKALPPRIWQSHTFVPFGHKRGKKGGMGMILPLAYGKAILLFPLVTKGEKRVKKGAMGDDVSPFSTFSTFSTFSIGLGENRRKDQIEKRIAPFTEGDRALPGRNQRGYRSGSTLLSPSISSPLSSPSPPFLTFRIWLLKASLLLIPWDKSHTFLEVWRSHMRKAEGRGGFSFSFFPRKKYGSYPKG